MNYIFTEQVICKYNFEVFICALNTLQQETEGALLNGTCDFPFWNLSVSMKEKWYNNVNKPLVSLLISWTLSEQP